jgi:phosphoglycolate phosphatase
VTELVEKRVPAVVFDLDGTLIDSSRDILDCIERSFSSLDLPLRAELTPASIGPPLPDMLKAMAPELSDTALDNSVTRFRELYAASGFPLTVIYDGVEELLESLQSKNIRCLIATNKPRHLTQDVLSRKNLARFIDDWKCIGDDGAATKTELLSALMKTWNACPALTWMVGDSASDITAAQGLGIKSIAHLGGYGARDGLLACGPDYAVERMSDAKPILERTFDHDS